MIRFCLIFLVVVFATVDRLSAQELTDSEKELATLLDSSIKDFKVLWKEVDETRERLRESGDVTEQAIEKEIQLFLANRRPLFAKGEGKAKLDRIDALMDEWVVRALPDHLAFRNFTDARVSEELFARKKLEMEHGVKQRAWLSRSIQDASREGSEESVAFLFFCTEFEGYLERHSLIFKGLEGETKTALRESLTIDSWESAALFLAVAYLSAAFEQVDDPAGRALLAGHIRRLAARGVPSGRESGNPLSPAIADKLVGFIEGVEGKRWSRKTYLLESMSHDQLELCGMEDTSLKREAWLYVIREYSLRCENLSESQLEFLSKSHKEIQLRHSVLDANAQVEGLEVGERTAALFRGYLAASVENDGPPREFTALVLLELAGELVEACGNKEEAREIEMTQQVIQQLDRKDFRVANPLVSGIKFHRWEPVEETPAVKSDPIPSGEPEGSPFEGSPFEGSPFEGSNDDPFGSGASQGKMPEGKNGPSPNGEADPFGGDPFGSEANPFGSGEPSGNPFDD